MAEAYRAFKKAQALDPGCAMCFWGEAFVLGANINAAMEPGAVQPAFVALTNAKARSAGASARERALIDALATRYSPDPDADPAALAGAYADAMAAAHAQHPDDQDIAVLFADALMNTSPWDYWELDGRTLKGRLGEAAAALEGVLADDPDHPGAIHMYIHLTEASATPEKAEPYADRLAALMPAAGHVVHMPSHTYYRTGRYLDSLKTNIKAVEADEAYLAQVEATGAYPYGYYPHNIHFVLVSAQMAGDAEHMLWAAERLHGKIPDEVAAEVGWIQIILPAPYFAHAQFSPPDVVLGLEDPGDTFPFVKAMWHYARGVAHAAKGDLDAARAEAARISDINQSADFEMLLAWARAGAGRAAARAACPRGSHRAGGGQPRAARSRSSRWRCRSRTRCRTWSPSTGTIRCGNRSARRCSWPGAPTRRPKCSGRLSSTRRTTAGRFTA